MNDEQSKQKTTNDAHAFRVAMIYDSICNILMTIVFMTGFNNATVPSVIIFSCMGLLSITAYMLTVADYMYKYGISATQLKLDVLKIVATVLNHATYILFVAFVISSMLHKMGWL